MEHIKIRFKFWNNVFLPINATDEDCWIWRAAKDKDGYGLMRIDSKMVRVHRISWLLHRGEIGKLHVLHKCDCPSCINPNHLFLGTNTDNIVDRDSKGRNGNANKTSCIRGHPYSGDNLYIDKKGRRYCRTCARENRSPKFLNITRGIK